MKSIATCLLLLTAGIAWSQDEAEDQSTDSSSVDLRMEVLEVIDVTADKTVPDADVEEDPGIDEILEEAEALEDEEN